MSLDHEWFLCGIAGGLHMITLKAVEFVFVHSDWWSADLVSRHSDKKDGSPYFYSNFEKNII